MAHNNKTPATVLTAPSSVVKPVALHMYPVLKEATATKPATLGKLEHHVWDGKIDTQTGVYTNPKRVQRKIRAAEKRAKRNKQPRRNRRTAGH